MTNVAITNIADDYEVSTFSGMDYPDNQDFEITVGQRSVLKSLLNCQDREAARAATAAFAAIVEEEVAVEDREPGSPASGPAPAAEAASAAGRPLASPPREIPPRAGAFRLDDDDFATETPSISVAYNKDERIRYLEDEVKKLSSAPPHGNSNLKNFTSVLFNRASRQNNVNKRIVIVHHASLNNAALTLEDLDNCSEGEIDEMYSAIRQLHDGLKKKVLVSNAIIICVNLLEQVLVRVGLAEARGMSAEISSELIDLEIGEDCEQVATSLGIGNYPLVNIAFFLVKHLVRRVRF
ncbi:ORF168 [Saltwater crocodilepox virus]|nr:ORF171 [Saltwater crocodilepox virus]QGT47685.1 ORF168 [Saltwater crocodilepox virus]